MLKILTLRLESTEESYLGKDQFCYYYSFIHTIDQSVKQQYNQLPGSATKNVTKPGLASE